jgi:hypothetical protein
MDWNGNGGIGGHRGESTAGMVFFVITGSIFIALWVAVLVLCAVQIVIAIL